MSFKRELNLAIDEVKNITTEDWRRSVNEAFLSVILKTPVDTGAYAESHSISSNATAKRSVSSANREGKQNISKFQGIARSNLESDISSLGDDDFEIYAINGAPHASAVEHKHNYKVYTQTTRNANNHIADGIGKARSQ